MNFSENLKKIRKEKKITQKQIADFLNIKQQAISQYESGITIPKADVLRKIAECLDVSVNYLLDSTEDTDKDDLTEDAQKLLELYRSLPSDKKNISLELLKVLQNNTEQDGNNGK